MDIIQNRTLPGFYNTFKAVPMTNYQQRGTLGVVAIGMAMDWGKDDEPTELLSEDLITGASLKKIGYTLNDKEKILPYMLALISAPKGHFVKLNKNGVKAKVSVGDIDYIAKYTGIFGNKLSVIVASNTPSSGKYTITVNVSGVRKETFVVSNGAELLATNSAFIDFTSDETSPAITPTNLATLVGGTNGEIIENTTSGVKASKTIGSLVFTAKEEGEGGNEIGITIAENSEDSSKYDLKINVNSIERESYTALEDVAGFVAVDSTLVTITNPSGSTIDTATNELLVGGADAQTSSFQKFKDELKYKQFNVCAITLTSNAANTAVIEFVNNQVNNKNKLITGIVFNKPMFNNKSIVSVEQGLECDDFTVSEELNIALVASMRAGCPLNESLTDNNMTELVGARKIINPINDDDDTEMENAIAQGRFVYRYINDGSVRVLQDINTLVNFTTDEPKGYRKNRHIAIMNYLVNEEHRMAHDGIIGKYSNVEEKRNNISARFLTIFKELHDMSAIKDYDPLTDMQLTVGDDTDVVNVNQVVKPTDSIEILNVTTNVDFNITG